MSTPKVSLLTTSDSKHWNRSLQSRPMIISSASLPELGPVAGVSGRGSVHSGMCWTWRICLFDKRAAGASGSWHLFRPVVLCSEKSTKRAEGNMEGISLDWAREDGRAELQGWLCVPGAKRRACGTVVHLHLLTPTPFPQGFYDSLSLETHLPASHLQQLCWGQDFGLEFMFLWKCKLTRCCNNYFKAVLEKNCANWLSITAQPPPDLSYFFLL